MQKRLLAHKQRIQRRLDLKRKSYNFDVNVDLKEAPRAHR